MLSFLRNIFIERWPAGEPLILADGERIGTRAPDGTLILASGWQATPLSELSEQELAEAVKQERATREAQVAAMLPTVSSPSLAPSAGILSPLSGRMILSAIGETYRAARAAGSSVEQAFVEANEAGQRLARLIASAGLECES